MYLCPTLLLLLLLNLIKVKPGQKVWGLLNPVVVAYHLFTNAFSYPLLRLIQYAHRSWQQCQ